MLVFRHLILYFVEILALKAVTLWQQIDCLNENYTLKMLIYQMAHLTDDVICTLNCLQSHCCKIYRNDVHTFASSVEVNTSF